MSETKLGCLGARFRGCITNKTSYLAPLPVDDIILEMTFCTGNLS